MIPSFSLSEVSIVPSWQWFRRTTSLLAARARMMGRVRGVGWLCGLMVFFLFCVVGAPAGRGSSCVATRGRTTQLHGLCAGLRKHHLVQWAPFACFQARVNPVSWLRASHAQGSLHFVTSDQRSICWRAQRPDPQRVHVAVGSHPSEALACPSRRLWRPPRTERQLLSANPVSAGVRLCQRAHRHSRHFRESLTVDLRPPN